MDSNVNQKSLDIFKILFPKATLDKLENQKVNGSHCAHTEIKNNSTNGM